MTETNVDLLSGLKLSKLIYARLKKYKSYNFFHVEETFDYLDVINDYNFWPQGTLSSTFYGDRRKVLIIASWRWLEKIMMIMDDKTRLVSRYYQNDHSLRTKSDEKFAPLIA